jgi:hypothetical protein
MSQDAEMFLKAPALYHGLLSSYQALFMAGCSSAKTVTKK